MKIFICVIGSFFLSTCLSAQTIEANPIGIKSISFKEDKDNTSLINYKKRKLLIGGLSVAGYGGSLLLLNEAWYKQYPKSSFHTYNDAAEWLQVDKVGHAWTAYNTSRGTTALWKWAGLSNNQAVLTGSLSGFAYMTVIELLDAHSTEWGWSWADMAANFSGSLLFASQQIGWKEQRIQFKFSSHKKRYPTDLEGRADDLYGASLPERILKDYNGQAYWLSFNLNSFLPETKLPSWLNLAIGYGADDIFGGFGNIAVDKNGSINFNRPDIKRYRQWYLAPDLDLTKIKTNSKLLRTGFAVFNSLKIPAPTLELSKGKLKGRWLYF